MKIHGLEWPPFLTLNLHFLNGLQRWSVDALFFIALVCKSLPHSFGHLLGIVLVCWGNSNYYFYLEGSGCSGSQSWRSWPRSPWCKFTFCIRDFIFVDARAFHQKKAMPIAVHSLITYVFLFQKAILAAWAKKFAPYS